MPNLIWSPVALMELEAIKERIARDAPLTALRFIQELIEAPERLTRQPESAPLLAGCPGFRRILHKGYRIIYSSSHDQVTIHRVVNERQLLSRSALPPC